MSDHRLRLIGIAVLCVTALGFAAFAVISMKVFLDQRELIAVQDRKQALLLERALPVVDAVRPLVAHVRQDRPRAQRAARDAAALVDATADAGLPEVVRGGGALLEQLLRGDRLDEALRGSTEMARQVREEDLVAKLSRTARELDATLPRLAEAADTAPQLRGIARELLSLQRRSLALQETLLATQEEALQRIRSLDRKTGGQVPATPVPAAAAP